MYSKVLDHLKQIVIFREISLSVVSNMSKCIIKNIIFREISLSVVSNMSKCIIKNIKFCIGNVLIEFGISELW